jgi:polar amino acid transport system substrate-binding protein
MVYTEEFPPYNFTVNGEISGINIRLVKAACEEAKIECLFEMYPWNRAMRMALSGPNTGIVSTARTEERETQFSWVGPLKSSQNCIYKLASRNDVTIPNLKAASNYVMGASTDSAYRNVLKTLGFEVGKNLKIYREKYGSARPFAAQRVDLIVGSANSIELQLAAGGLTLKDVVPVAKIDNSHFKGNYLALHPAIDAEVVDKLQSSLDRLVSSGAAKEIELEFTKPISLNSAEMVNPALWDDCMRAE